jgi:hypothetical protein
MAQVIEHLLSKCKGVSLHLRINNKYIYIYTIISIYIYISYACFLPPTLSLPYII